MRDPRTLATLLIAVVLLGALATPVAADVELSIDNVNVPDSVTQGDSFDLTVSVSGDDLENDEVDVSLTLPEGISCSPEGTQTVTLGTDGSTEAIFDCTGDVEGDYSGEITASASATARSSSSGSDPDTRTKQTGIEVLSPASFTLSTSLDASSIEEGSTTTLSAVIHNAGDASGSYTLSTESGSGYSISVASGSESGTVHGGSSRTVEYSVSGDAAGDHTLTSDLSGGNGQSLSEDDALTVESTGGDNNGDNNGGGGGGGSGNESTPTPSPTPTATSTPTATQGSTETETAVRTPTPETDTGTTMASETPAATGTEQTGTGGASGETTSGADGPGFGPVATVLALVAAMLLARHRR